MKRWWGEIRLNSYEVPNLPFGLGGDLTVVPVKRPIAAGRITQMKRWLYEKMLSCSMACALTSLTFMSAVSSQVEAATQTSGSNTLSLSVKKTVAYIHGTVHVPAGTLLMVHILSNGNDEIDWLTTVGSHGAVSTQNDISWLQGGKDMIQAKVYQVPNQPKWSEKSPLEIVSNSVSAMVQHQDVGFDVRRYYKPGTPTYALADFVYIDHWNDQSSEFDWYDVLPGQDDTYFVNINNYNFWYVTDGVAEYHLQMTSSTKATIQTRLLVEVVSYPSQQPYYEDYVSSPSMVYCTFKLSKVGGVWLINNIKDIENTLISASIRTS